MVLVDIDFTPAGPDSVAQTDQTGAHLRDHARVLGAFFNELIRQGFGREEAFDLVQERQRFDLYGKDDEE